MAGLASYAASLVLWLLALREVPLTVAYPFMGLALVFVALLAMVVLGERLSGAQLLGMAFVCVGLTLLARP